MAFRIRTRLGCESLQDRITPALTFSFDYRYDTAGLFANPVRRAMLEQAGHDLTARIADTPLAITPSGLASWKALFFNPANGEQAKVPNLSVPEGTLVIFVGGRNLAGSEAGVGGRGGYSAGGSAAWKTLLAHRGLAGFSLWGGSISFDTSTNWYFGSDAKALSTTQTDFYSVATHELGHVLGFGASDEFSSKISGQFFSGSQTVAANGGVAPRLSSDLAHFAADTVSDGQPVSMQPYLQANLHYGFTSLDYAALSDIGWTITTPKPIATLPPITAPHLGEAFIISGSSDGTFTRYALTTASAVPVPVSTSLQPFADFTGGLRTATADVNGDGVEDTICVTEAGGPSRLTVLDGRVGNRLIEPITVFGIDFTGGLFVSAADFDHDGQAEVVVSPDRGGGGRVTVFNFAHGVQRLGDFFGIEDVNFRGGARVAAADVNGDGTPDIVVGAGIGGGPRVALFDGTTISRSKPGKLLGDFFAFPGNDDEALRNGVYVSAGDLNGDGKADLIFGAGPGGGPRVFVLDATKVLAGDVDAARFAPLANFFAFDVNDRGGVPVTVLDIDGDHRLDLIATNGPRQQVTYYRGATATWNGTGTGTGMSFTLDAADLENIFVG
ncbi:hypothetical protein BH11PLA2_BH11PLA2_19640 [soil metagenome]